MSEHIDTQIRPEVRTVLNRLRARIRRYVFLEGLALVLVVLALMFWLSLGIDAVYFYFSRLELPRWFRVGFDVIAFSLFVFTFLVWVAMRFWRRFQTKALALVLERRFPELDDRLITAVQVQESTSGQESALTSAMLNTTVRDVARCAERLEVGQVFNSSPLRRAAIGAAVLIASIVAFGVTNASAMNRWVSAFVNFDDVYWDRETRLIVRVLAQPNDQVKNFHTADGESTDGEPGEYKHPRSGDLTLLVDVPEGTNGKGAEWKVPENVEIYYRDAQGNSNRASLSKLGERQFQHSIGGVLDSMEFWVRGGDFTNRQPYRVTVVDAPRVDQIELVCNYPQYTGMNGVAPANRKVAGTQISIPGETRFDLHGTSNKPLTSVRLQTEYFDITLKPDAGAVTLFFEEGSEQRVLNFPPEAAAKLISSDGTQFHIPFRLTRNATDDLIGLEDPSLIPLPPDTPMRIYLTDRDDIASVDPARLTVNSIVDLPPMIETELRGIGTAITRQADIPVWGLINDDYGVVKARFEFRVDDDEEWRQRPFRNPPEALPLPGSEELSDIFPKDFRLRMPKPADRLTGNEDAEGRLEEFEKFAVVPLDLKVGQRLTLVVYAEDGDNINGPHESRSERYVFKIVTAEELLSLLYGKEIGLRQQFEQIIREVEGTHQDLATHRDLYAEMLALQDKGPEPGKEQEFATRLAEMKTAVEVSAERSLHQVRKNASETAAVEVRFGDILDELVNNKVHTDQMVDRIRGLIMTPLHGINTIDYPETDQAIGLFKLANEREQDPRPRIDESLVSIETMLQHMRQVLAEMQELASFHEAINNLKLIIDDTESLKNETDEERKKRLLDGLKKLGLE